MKRLTKAQKAKNRAMYKYIRKIWEKTDKSVSYKDFKRIVIDWTKAGKYDNIREGAKLYAHSTQYVDATQRGKENILSGLKSEFRGTYDDLRHKIGFMKKGEHLIDRLQWDDTKQGYTFEGADGKTYLIDISNSPKQADLIQL